MMKVAIYTRVSTEDQAREGYSLEVQKEYLIDHIKRMDWQTYKIYTDDGVSGYTLERPALKAMIQDAKAKKFELIVTYKLDRFSRKLRDLLNLVEELDGYGVAYKSATEPFDTTTSTGKLMFQQLGSFAEFERNRLKERIFPGMIKGVMNGNWQGARYAPYGYYYDKSKKILEVIPEEAENVKLIYNMYLSGQSSGAIAEYFYSKKYKTRSGGFFHSALIRNILRNPIYVGKIVWNRNHYDFKQTTSTRKGFKYVKNDPSKLVTGKGKHQPIIADNVFNIIQERMDANRRGKVLRKNSFEYPLTGVLYCASCGHKYHGSSGTSNHRLKMRKRWYKCSSMGTHHLPCSNSAVKAEDIEPSVFGIIEKIFSHPAIVNGRLANLTQTHVYLNNMDIKDELDKLLDALSANLEKQRKINDSYTDNLMGAEIYREKIFPLREEEKNIKSSISKCRLQIVEKERSGAYLKTLKLAVDNFDRTKKKLSIVEKKEALKLIFKSIKVRNGKIESFELYEPFKKMYKEVKEKCNTLKNQSVTAKSSNDRSACILEPSDAR